MFAVPISVGGAIFLVERLPPRVQGFLGIFLELLAGIPSVIFGLWGIYTFGPFLSRTVYRWIAALGIPWLRGRNRCGRGCCWLRWCWNTVEVIVPAWCRPLVSWSDRVRALAKEGAVALGLTRSETVRFVVIPYIRTGSTETIAVLIIGGDLLGSYPHSVFDPSPPWRPPSLPSSTAP